MSASTDKNAGLIKKKMLHWKKLLKYCLDIIIKIWKKYVCGLSSMSSTVIKSLALPILVQIPTVLPNPPDNILKDMQKSFDKFLWNAKRDKVKREILTNSYEDGGWKSIKNDMDKEIYRSFKFFSLENTVN